MNKKILYLIIILIVIIAVSIGIFFCLNNTNNENNNENVTTDENNSTENDENIEISSNNNILITYFSVTGTTKNIAEYIADETNGDLVEIVPKEKYSSDDLNYNNNCRANREQNDNSSRPEIENNINFDNYNIIFVGYPIWWGDVPKIILTLLDTYNLEGKTVIPFCTSGGSGINQSENTLKSYNTNIRWLEGKRFSSSSTKTEVSVWIQGLILSKGE